MGKGSAIITAEVDGIKTTCKVKVKVIKIYLSPSNQNANTYATGNTNEMAQCDKIAAATAKALDRCGFEVMVAKSGTLMQKRCPESDKFGADIHMPIHTNASGSGNYTGGTRVFCLNSSGKKPHRLYAIHSVQSLRVKMTLLSIRMIFMKSMFRKHFLCMLNVNFMIP